MNKALKSAREVALAKLPDLASARRKSLYREHGTLAEKTCLHGLTDDESARLAVAAEEFARAEVARLRAIEAKFAECAGLIERLDPGHAHLCPRAVSGFEHCRCNCDYDAREALRKLAES